MTEAEEAEYQEAREERRRNNRTWMIVAVGIMAGAFALMAFAASWVVVRSANERQAICESAANERKVLRKVLIFSRDSAAVADGMDPVERAVVAKFYRDALALAPEVKCSNGSIERR